MNDLTIGILIGGGLFGGALGTLGWVLGFHAGRRAGARKVLAWMRRRREIADEMRAASIEMRGATMAIATLDNVPGVKSRDAPSIDPAWGDR